MFLGYVPCKNKKEAEKIGKTLVEKRMIACANIIPSISSCYKWKGKICNTTETLLLIKTVKSKKKIITNEVKRMHSYKTPCIGFLEFKDINKGYEIWVKKNSY
ncbi:MAG: divalent-cation tolerance protein CutA [Candidatus Micrarchaeota archaeon]